MKVLEELEKVTCSNCGRLGYHHFELFRVEFNEFQAARNAGMVDILYCESCSGYSCSDCCGPVIGRACPHCRGEMTERGPNHKMCFIATAALREEDEPHLALLREFRDCAAARSSAWAAMFKIYYRWSPPVAEWIRYRPIPRALVRRLIILPLAAIVQPVVNRWRKRPQ